MSALHLEIDRGGVAAANQDANPFPLLWLIPARQQGRESGRAARLGGNSQHLPKRLLRLLNGLVGYQQHALHVRLRDREHQFADPFWGQRIGRDAACFGIDGASCRPGPGKGWRGFRFHADDLDSRVIPGGDAADQPASADRNQHGVDLWRLLFELQTDASLAEQRFRLIIGVHYHRAGLCRPQLARRQRIGISFAGHHQIRSVFPDSFKFRRRRNFRNKNSRRLFQLHCGKRNRRAVIAARGRDHSHLGNLAHQQVGKSASRLERTGML